jgi:outer membrane protein assembly factor BamD
MAGCTKYQKVLKNPDPNKKLEMAQYYYNKKDYYRAGTLFEQLQDNFSGTKQAEKIMYYSAYCNYALKNYSLAGFQFKAYFENFPTGEWAEESFYMSAYCMYLESQPVYLDQTDTFKAIEAIKLFVNVYPDSKYIPECNAILDKLRAKLSQKAYNTAKLYFDIAEYKSAIVAIENALRDYPEIAQHEELEYLLVKSHFLLAENSVEEKKEERYKNTMNAYEEFMEDYRDSKYQPELNNMLIKSKRELEKIERRKQSINQ